MTDNRSASTISTGRHVTGRPTDRSGAPGRRSKRTVGRWLASFLGFPIGGYIAALVIGPLDTTVAALAGGALAGAVIGAAQAWALGPHGPRPIAWIGGTAVGLAAGLAIGASVVDYSTDLTSLMWQGAVSGAGVGLAQTVTLLPRFRARALLWPPALTALWALGWLVTDTVIGSSVDQQFYVFGASGALVVTILTALLPLALDRRDTNATDPRRTDTHATASGASNPTNARIAASSLGLASLLAIAGFTVLGMIFEYPQILEQPTADVLALFRAKQAAVTFWFLVLVISASLMAPGGIFLGRMTGGTLGRWIARVGVAAAIVQVIGLQRWVTLVPGIAEDALDRSQRADAEARFELWHTLLGKAIGETVGYALTGVFTVLVVLALRRSILPTWASVVGTVAAALIATGVVIPVVPAASLANFAGYVVWCLWLLIVAGLLLRSANDGQNASSGGASEAPERARIHPGSLSLL